MTEHISEAQITAYWRCKLGPAELLAIDDHLAVCAVCRGRLASHPAATSGGKRIAPRPVNGHARESAAEPAAGQDKLASAIAMFRADLDEAGAGQQHLLYEQISAWVDGRLDDADREIVQSHLEDCASCAAEVKDLQTFAELTRARPAEARAGDSPCAKSTGRGWARFRSIWSGRTTRDLDWGSRAASWAWRPLAGAALATALLVIASTAGFVLWKVRDLRSKSAAVALSGTPPGSTARSGNAAATVAQGPSRNPGAAAAAPPGGGREALPLISLNIGDGRTLTMTDQGTVSGLDGYPSGVRAVVESTLRTAKLATPPILATLVVRPRTVRDVSSAPAPFDLVGPAGTVVLTDTPAFRWRRWTGATAYTVRVMDVGQEEVARSPLQSGTEWTIDRPLQRGRTYTWQVTAIGHGEEHSATTASGRQAKFQVLEASKVAELSGALTRYSDSPLILAILDAQSGLLDDAQVQLEALSRANRDASPAARALTGKLLADLRASRSTGAPAR